MPSIGSRFCSARPLSVPSAAEWAPHEQPARTRRRDNGGAVADHSDARPIATLWQLAWDQERVFCTVYRSAGGLQLRVESATAVIVDEPFDLQPRALARTQALRASLKRRGWREVASGDCQPRTSDS